jgi:hypothetical protein
MFATRLIVEWSSKNNGVDNEEHKAREEAPKNVIQIYVNELYFGFIAFPSCGIFSDDFGIISIVVSL